MQFTCAMEDLVSAVSNVQRAVAAKSAVPALEGILLRTTHNALFVAGFDMELGITTTIPASVKELGEIVVSSRLFGDIVRKMPGDSVSFSCDEKGNTTIRSEMTSFTISGISAADYPELPSVSDGVGFTLPQNVLKSMIRQTLFAVAQPNDPRPICTGTKFELAGGKLKLISVDGYRLALRREAVEGYGDDCSFIVPGTALSDLERLCGDSDERVVLSVGSKHISFTVGNTVILSRRLEGDFLNYKKAIPESFRVTVKTARTDLLEVVERVSLIIDSKNNAPLRLTFRKDAIDFVCTTPLGKAADSCPCEGEGGDLEIGFNDHYLSDALKAAPADEINVCLNTGSSPCILVPADGSDNFVYMVLPVRLRAGQ